MAYTDFGLKDPPTYTIDLLRKWINAYKILWYPNGWPKEKPFLSKKTLSK